jgi:hypothetical protein
MELQEIEWNDVVSICVTQNRDKGHAVVFKLVKLPVPFKAGNFLTA